MKERINTYFAVFIIVVVGVGAATLITHVANADYSQYAVPALGL